MNDNRSIPSYTLATVIALAALAALAVLPLIMNSRTNAMRAEIEETARPARRRLNQVNYLLSVQISNLSIAAATGNSQYLADYRAASAARARVMEMLGRDVQPMGSDVVARYADLEAHVARWEQAVARALLAENRTGMAVERETTYASVIQDLQVLDDEISAFEARLTNGLRRLLLMETRISIALVIVAILAAATVLRLQLRVRGLTAGLEEALGREREARETAETLLRGRDEILGVVSHDLRSPLTAISLSAQMLPPNEYVDTIRATTKRMERLIEDLLDAVRVEKQRLSIRHDAVDAAAVARDVTQSHQLIAAEKGIELESDIGADLPPIAGDHDRLVQALTNLVGNALKFTPEGGKVSLFVRAGVRGIQFVVEDTGPGIEEADIDRLFEPFWQAKKTAHLGAGLGLKITRGIIEAHGGTIEVSNRRKGGARFAFEIPRAAGLPTETDHR